MTYLEATTRSIGRIGFLDRAIRGGLGLAVLMATLHLSIDTGGAYPFIKIFASLMVLTSIAGWDPFYALFRSIVGRMTSVEAISFSEGNIGMVDRAVRIVLGLSILIASLQGSISDFDAYPFVKMIAAMIVLTGIAGWDPLYAAFRNLMTRIWHVKPYQYMAQRGYI